MASTGEHFIARQAIFDRARGVAAYELFFRTGLENFFAATDGDMATERVVSDSFLLFGIEELTGGTRAYINFTRSILTAGCPLLLPRDKVVVEILETVRPDEEVLHACRRLKSEGYVLALDDFVLSPGCEGLLDLADIVKIDFRQTQGGERTELSRTLRRRGLTLLAEKVETPEEHEEAQALGYELFQGYYFSRPTVHARRDLPSNQAQYLRFLRDLNLPELRFDDLASTIQADVSLSFKLLRYINTAAFGLRNRVTSIRQALTYLGEREVRKWGSLVALSELSSGRPAELLRLALVRARLAELVAMKTGLARRAADVFLLGLFSLLDAMLDRPLPDILAELPLAEDLSAALAGERNWMGRILNLVLAVERADWQQVGPAAALAGVSEEDLPAMQIDALRFPDRYLPEEAGAPTPSSAEAGSAAA